RRTACPAPAPLAALIPDIETGVARRGGGPRQGTAAAPRSRHLGHLSGPAPPGPSPAAPRPGAPLPARGRAARRAPSGPAPVGAPLRVALVSRAGNPRARARGPGVRAGPARTGRSGARPGPATTGPGNNADGGVIDRGGPDRSRLHNSPRLLRAIRPPRATT